jgi:hypothetical protein
MRFFCYTLGDESVPLTPPSPEEMARLGPFMEEASTSGVLVATGGLAPTSQGVHVRNTGGSLTVTDGPFIEAKELIGGWMLLETASKQAAVDWMKRLLAITGGDARIREVFGPEHFGNPDFSPAAG